MTRKGKIMAKKKQKKDKDLVGLTQQLIIAEEVDIAYFEKGLDELRQTSVEDLQEVLTDAIQRLIEKNDARDFVLINLVDPTLDVESFAGNGAFAATTAYYVERIAAAHSPLLGIVFVPEAATLATIANDEEHEYYLPLSVEQVVELLTDEEADNPDNGSPFEELLRWLDTIGRFKSKRKTKKAHTA